MAQRSAANPNAVQLEPALEADRPLLVVQVDNPPPDSLYPAPKHREASALLPLAISLLSVPVVAER